MINQYYIDIFWQFYHAICQTLLVTTTCFITGMFVGLFVTSLRWILPWAGYIVDVFTFIFRAVPVLVLIFLVYFGLPILGIRIGSLTAMNLSLGVVVGAYLSEVFRGALLSIDPSELLAAKAMGMTKWQVFIHIAMPQMLRFSFPGIVNEFTSTLKKTSYAGMIGIIELTKYATTLTSALNHALQIYFFIGLLYFLLYKICLFSMSKIEQKYRIY